MLHSFLKHSIAVTLVLLGLLEVNGQTSTLSQTVKGTVRDKILQQPLIGATVVITDQSGTTLGGTTTDVDGRFKLAAIPVGNQRVKVSFLGYEPLLLSHVQVISGKELDLVLDMEESLLSSKEVVITAEREKQTPLNELSTVSTRTFSVEEAQRYAAAANDPGRMASAFAGVVAANDGSNLMVIRGNAPNSMIWRMEGVDIPNPNHFSAVGSSGGGISILSAQVLSNSDFSTGAFAAEYGNALSGVFDMRLRKGNTDKREHTAQIGVLGLDFASEGPIKMGRQTGSYLVNYRYSTLGVLANLGLDLGGAVTTFQDVSFNVFLPTAHAGTFTLFGIGGLSKQTAQGDADTSTWSESFFNRYPIVYGANTGVLGITHQYAAGRWHLKNVLAASGTRNEDDTDEFQLDGSSRSIAQELHTQTKLTLSSTLSYKLNAQNYFRLGTYSNLLGYDLNQAAWVSDQNQLVEQVQASGKTSSNNFFLQWQHRANERLTASVGVHGMVLALNSTWAADPRASLKYKTSARGTATIGYGLHSQTQPLGIYFAKNTESAQYNQDLKFSRAHHLVLGYEHLLAKHTRVKLETYYQHLFNIPIQSDSATSYSVINLIQDYPAVPLTNTGLGRNYGIELTLERYLNKGFYYLLSTSLYDSEYRASDGRWRNTQFNVDYASSLVAGKEWNWNRRKKNRTIGLNIKLTHSGGLREAPLDLEASRLKGESVYNQEEAFSAQLPDYFRLDTGLRIKRNYRHMTTTLGLDIQNTTNRTNLFGRYYDPLSQNVKEFTQTPLLPLLSYKLQW